MRKLITTLDKTLDVLLSLTKIIDAERQQLLANQINSHLLYRIAEDKSSLLNTLNYLDEMRRNVENELGLSAPYSEEPTLSQCWKTIRQHIVSLHNANQHNGMLLDHQAKFTEQALSVLHPHVSQAFYGSDGQKHSNVPGHGDNRRCFEKNL